MKRTVIGIVIILVVLGGITLYKPQAVEYTNPEPQVVEKEVQVDALEKEIKNAQESKMSEIKSTAQKAYDAAYDQEMKKVELEVIKSFNSKLNERQIQLEKDTKTY